MAIHFFNMKAKSKEPKPVILAFSGVSGERDKINDRYQKAALELGDVIGILEDRERRGPFVEELLQTSNSSLKILFERSSAKIWQSDEEREHVEGLVQGVLNEVTGAEPRVLRVAMKSDGVKTVGLLFYSKESGQCAFYSPFIEREEFGRGKAISFYNKAETLLERLEPDFSERVYDSVRDFIFAGVDSEFDSDSPPSALIKDDLYKLVDKVNDMKLQKKLYQTLSSLVGSTKPLKRPTYSERLVSMTKKPGKDVLVLIDKSKEKSMDKEREGEVQGPSPL